MCEDEVGDVQGKDGEGVVEGIVLQGYDIVEDYWDGGDVVFVEGLCVGAGEDVFADDDD